jgi:plastocyanin
MAAIWPMEGAVGAAAKPGPHSFRVTIADMKFGPAPANARVGDVIEWVNADIFQHTVTARNGAFDVDLAPGARARTKLRKPGRVAFYCRYHPGMTGVILVAPRGR